MDKYYYLAAQLPFLKFNERTYLTRKGFLAEAKKWLSEGDFKLLSRLELSDFHPRPDDFGILLEYKNFEKALRQEIALTRGAMASAEYRPRKILKPKLLEGSPLDVERKLLRFRWEFIEEKEADNYFNLEFLILYFLKLQILERLFTFDKDKGTAIFDKLCEIHPTKDEEKLWVNV